MRARKEDKQPLIKFGKTELPVLVRVTSYKTRSLNLKGEYLMSTEENKAVARGTVDAINAGDMPAFESLLAPDGVEHAAPPGMPQTRETAIQFISMLRAAFPDLHYTLEDVIAEGDLVVQRATASGTMKGEFLGMPATGKSATWTEIHIVRVKDGKIVEHWANSDQVGMMQQLGLMPAPGQ